MSTIEKRICHRIFVFFLQLGRGPTAAELAEHTTLSLTQVVTTLTRMSTRDMLKYDAQTGCVIALYPFSNVPCPHQVQLASKQRLYAM